MLVMKSGVGDGWRGMVAGVGVGRGGCAASCGVVCLLPVLVRERLVVVVRGRLVGPLLVLRLGVMSVHLGWKGG